LQEENKILRLENLRMRLELEILVNGTESKAAKKILAKYRRKREERTRARLESEN